ncbi:MAG: DUF6273 domain-containing protein [Clostridia bacterium]
MKKLISVFVCLTLCLTGVLSALAESAQEYTVGSKVTLGHYEQDNLLENGKEPVDWIVIDTDGTKALLMSEYCLDARAYNKRFIPMTWAQCDLRTWLNSDFLNELFTKEEQEKICATELENKDNTHYSTPGGKNTTDKIFFLSLTETESYFPEAKDRVAKPTPYAIARGAFVNKDNGNAWWWLRTPGVRPIDACGVRADGRISGYGSRDVNRPSGALRPVLWVDFGK